MAGSARAQYDLRRSCVFLDMHPLNKPEVLIGQAQTKFDAEGNLKDEVARNLLRDLMANLAAWARRSGRSSNWGNKLVHPRACTRGSRRWPGQARS